MKKLLNFGYSALLFSMLISCSQEGILNEHHDNNSRDTSPYRVSLNEALRHADRLLGHLEGGKTRARMIESVKYYGSSDKTRSSHTQDTTYYIVNYANEGGFAILSADKRLDPVYAISDEGHLDIGDTTYNEGLKMYFEALNYAASNRLDTMTGRQEDLLPQPEIDSLNPDNPIGIYRDYSYQIAPMLTKAVRQWDQGNPYNRFCPQISGVPALAGCVPVAVGMIMSYYHLPKSYQSYTFDWEQMELFETTGEVWSSMIPRLIQILGNKDNLNSDYGLDATSTKIYKSYKRTFRNMGFQEPEDFKTFTCNRGVDYIKSGSPVFMMGNRANQGAGHVWIIDGLLYDWYESPTFENGIGGDGMLLHCVWGWGGRGNGYFKFDGHITPFFSHNIDGDNNSNNFDPSKTRFYELEFFGKLKAK